MDIESGKKKVNVYRIIWVSCIFLLLIVILVMVMDYKINYEYSTLEENNLYFYNCDGEICTTEVEDKNLELFSKYECRYEACPKYSRVLKDNYVLLKDSNNTYELYDYKEGIVISAGYDDYFFIDDNNIIVSKNKKYGIIDILDNVIVKPTYDQIGIITDDILSGFNQENIIARKKYKYGIINYKNGAVKEDFVHSHEELDQLLLTLQIQK